MPLNPTTADALGSAISSAVVGLSQEDKNDPVVIWQTIAGVIYDKLATDVTILIQALAITTNGSAATQVGPPSPIPLNPET